MIYLQNVECLVPILVLCHMRGCQMNFRVEILTSSITDVDNMIGY